MDSVLKQLILCVEAFFKIFKVQIIRELEARLDVLRATHTMQELVTIREKEMDEVIRKYGDRMGKVHLIIKKVYFCISLCFFFCTEFVSMSAMYFQSLQRS